MNGRDRADASGTGAAGDRAAFETAMERHGLVAILRGVDAAALAPRVLALHRAGVRLVEVALSHPGSLKALAELVRIAPADTVVGAGTVTSPELARAAHEAGAQYLVTPHVGADVFAYALDHDLGLLAGALTPTEVAAARAAGARFVKLFPASSMGPEYVRALRGPFPDLEVVVVGGVDSGNLGPYLEAGAVGAGVGGALAGNGDDGDPAAADEARRLVALLRGGRT